jgi:hypothetical protein
MWLSSAVSRVGASLQVMPLEVQKISIRIFCRGRGRGDERGGWDRVGIGLNVCR